MRRSRSSRSPNGIPSAPPRRGSSGRGRGSGPRAGIGPRWPTSTRSSRWSTASRGSTSATEAFLDAANAMASLGSRADAERYARAALGMCRTKNDIALAARTEELLARMAAS